ncbi:uncharacterized protein MONOS_2521 [Monocercomonoides exilis]|uniref:uncharacterized protein n=1 Tax=Monocercomonoides exilis TaxID=2049356 RepID=UPI00355A90CF|nr:hypothetical protein MONOS_2521 [Monocercomonoides exilis]|eukprot:MONOS_2521.1-p1 / transcript=MONOS_2521.1 / gene=MONOS_2521 / organism=Monocercomonoides_exilis_PA203 / gene_product=unspecified product / transcript_product=unspecified product / location=Mono_scaffold00052:113898-114366(-) / protein_length=135 / sequence_SO=supercontig / SO=protein_coding / is_pseudo=false
MEIEVDLGVNRGRRGKKEGLDEGDERGERGVGDGEGGGDWGVGRREEIIWGGEEGEGEDGRLRDEEGEVREGEGAAEEQMEAAEWCWAVRSGQQVRGTMVRLLTHNELLTITRLVSAQHNRLPAAFPITSLRME